MSLTPDDDAEEGSEEEVDPEIPAGVLRGIEDIDAGVTVDKSTLDSLLDF